MVFSPMSSPKRAPWTLRSAAIVFAMLALLPSSLANATRADHEPPAWIEALIGEQAEVLTGMLGLPRVPFIELVHMGPTDIPGERIIDARATRDKIWIDLHGDWDLQSVSARQQLVGNLAHELAHVWQFTLGTATESRFFHEGFAEAIAIDLLTQCGAACGGSPTTLLTTQSSHCTEALQMGALIAQRTELADYGCGTILMHAAATNSGSSPRDLYQAFAATDRTERDFLAVAEKFAGQPFANSAFTFLHNDHSVVPGQGVMRRLRSAKL